MPRGRKKAAATSVSINWADTEIRNPVQKPGEYLFKVTDFKANPDNDESLMMDAEVISKIQNGKTMRHYFNLQPQSLWVLAGYLEATGQEIPDDEGDLDFSEQIDMEFVGIVEPHEWDNKMYMRIRSFAPADEFDGEMPGKGKSKKTNDEEEDDRSSKKGKKKGKKEEQFSQDEINDMDEDELQEFVEEHELDVDLDDFKTLKKKRIAVIDAAEEADLIQDS